MPLELDDDRAPFVSQTLRERRELRGVPQRAVQEDDSGAQCPPRLRSAEPDLLRADATFSYRDGSTAT